MAKILSFLPKEAQNISGTGKEKGISFFLIGFFLFAVVFCLAGVLNWAISAFGPDIRLQGAYWALLVALLVPPSMFVFIHPTIASPASFTRKWLIGYVVVGLLMATSSFSAFIAWAVQVDGLAAWWAFALTMLASAFAGMTFLKLRNEEVEESTNCCTRATYWVVFPIWLLILTGIIIMATHHAVSLQIERTVFQPTGTLFQVNGRNMHLDCQGTGTPVVIYEHGNGGQGIEFKWIQPVLSNVTKACGYDRLGYGWSDKGPEPRDAVSVAIELEELLVAAGISKTTPLVLMGHSFAGFSMPVFWSRNQQQVVGMVMLDCVNANETEDRGLENTRNPSGLFAIAQHGNAFGLVRGLGKNLPKFNESVAVLPPQFQEAYRANIYKQLYFDTRNIEQFTYFPRSAQQAFDVGSLGDLPLLVIGATQGINSKSLVNLSSNSTYVEFDAVHGFPLFEEFGTRAGQLAADFLATLP